MFSYLKDQNCAIYFLQETFSQPQDELIWKTEWHGKIFFSHGSGSNHQKGVAIFINPLYCILRIKNPGKRCFTYESSTFKMKSRINFFLIPKSLIASIKTADVKTAIAPDHKAIRLFLQFESNKKGPGLWKFNNSLLNDDTFVNLITTYYPIICRKYAYLTNLKLKWEMIKMEIRSLTIPYAKNKARNVRNLEKQLESHMESLGNKMNTKQRH